MVAVRQSSRLVAGAAIGCLMVGMSGCALFQPRPAVSAQNPAFAWLTRWGGQPLDAAPGFELEALRPPPRAQVADADDLLEITIWDLYEPGKPYTFPVRVSEQRTIAVPFLGEFAVADHAIPQIEAGLRDQYRTAEYLVHPRVLVRSLDPPTVKVQVSGAVQRAGFVELSRGDSSVYAALVSAGGLKKTAGTQVSVERRTPGPRAGNRAADAETPPDRPNPGSSAGKHAPPEQRANTAEILTVEPAGAAPGSAEPNSGAAHSDAEAELANGASAATWYDLSKPEELEALRLVHLGDGDVVIVRAAVQPVRIGGIVNHPGAFPLPSGRTTNTWQALDLAGGVRRRDVPLVITLIRPAAEGRAARRWAMNVAEYERHPATAPMVEPGDVIHVEPANGSRIKRVVGDLWNKP
jgi:protein involved in polysaccharide export with SLBB domain